MKIPRFAIAFGIAACLSVGLAAGQAVRTTPAPGTTSPIRPADLERWLTSLSSDAMEGRANLTDGLVRAGEYLAAEARAIGLEPGAGNGTFFEDFSVLGVKTANRSTLTVEVNGHTRVFRDGDVVDFGREVGGRRSFTIDRVEFLGYGLDNPAIRHNDYAGKDLRGKAVVWLGGPGPKGSATLATVWGRNGPAERAGAAAIIGQSWVTLTPSDAAARSRRTGAAREPAVDFTTVRRLDDPKMPSVMVRPNQAEAFYSFLFSASGVTYADLMAKAVVRAPLPSFTLPGVKLTFNLDADYSIVRSNATRNVVGLVRGADPALAGTYVVLGAHYDHMGIIPPQQTVAGAKRPAAGAKPAPADRIYNGADDNGSGSVALLSVAKALLAGPRPRRTVAFVWFAGEERGLLGSQYQATYGRPIDRVVAMLNLDMIGRNQRDSPGEANTIYVIGSDRISTELHNINEDANRSLPAPLRLDYTYNDPADRSQLYFRSDHFSYASKGIPVIDFTTGMHPDYHRVTDSVDRIDFAKMARVAALICETVRRIADLDHAPVRDNLGPRTGKGRTGRITQ